MGSFKIFIVICIISFSIPIGLFSQTKKNECINCHKSLKDVRLKNPVFYWTNSVHSKTGKGCELCHGGDSTSSNKVIAKSKKAQYKGKPGKKTIPEFCGRKGCHNSTLVQFKKGPHYLSLLKTNKPNCTNCHSAHNIQKVSMRILRDQSCVRCHKEPFVKNIKKTIKDIYEKITVLDKNTNELKIQLVNTTKIENRISTVKKLFSQMVHVFSKQELASTQRIIRLELTNIKNETTSKIALHKRLDVIFIIMIVIGFSIVIGFAIYALYMFSKKTK